MKKFRKWTTLFLIFALIWTSMGSAFATYYDEYPSARNTYVSNICQQNVYYWDNYGNLKTKNTLRFTINWSNVESYSFNNENWYNNCNSSSRTFYLREDYYDKSAVSNVEVVLPKSVNVLFLYVKEYNSSQIRVFQYKISGSNLTFIYGKNPVPTHIISVTDAIDALPTKANLKLSDEYLVKNARASFDALGVDKVWVYNAHKLYDLESRLDELKSGAIDWTKIYKDLDAQAYGKLTEQYYDVPNKLYADLYVQADKTKIFQTKYKDPRYNFATIATDVLKSTTPDSDNVFFTYDFNHVVTKGVYSPAMAKKVWGFFTPTSSGKYQFKITSDDGHNWTMYLDDGSRLNGNGLKLEDLTTITSQFNLHNISEFTTGNYALKANTPYPLYIEYFNHGGNAALKMQYRITQDNGTVGPWTDMQGTIFRPSTAYEFGFLAGNPAELQKAVNNATTLVDTYKNLIGSTEGKVSQEALDQLKKALDEANKALQDAINGKLTQAQIDEATKKLNAAIEEFKNAIVKKPNGISAPFAAQAANQVLVEFNKDLSVNTYEIILSKDNQISSDDKVYSLTNGNFVLNGSSKINVVQGELSGALEKGTTENGKFSFLIPIDAYMASGSVNVFIRTATGDNKGDASPFFINILQTPKNFNYSVSDDNVIFYTVEKAGDTGFAIDYFAPNSTTQTRVFVVAKDKDYYVLPKSSVDLNKISEAKLYRIKLLNNAENFKGGYSVPKTNPVKIEIPSVENLKLNIEAENYTLTWNPYEGATAYEIYIGNSDDTSKMTRQEGTVKTPSLNLGKYGNKVPQYYAIRAVVNSEMFSKSGFSNALMVIKPTAPEVLEMGTTTSTRLITPPDKTNYVLKADGVTKGYYLITMPSELLNLTDAYDVKAAGDGDFIAKFPEVSSQTSASYKILGTINTSRDSLNEQAKTVTIKVPYGKDSDVGFTLQALKNTLTSMASQNVSIVKVVSNDGESMNGISAPTVIVLNVDANRPDITNDYKISGAKFENDTILSQYGDEFVITYKYHINADAVYNPNFVFTFKENAYFAYDYPTLTAYYLENGSQKSFDYETAVTKSGEDKVTKVVLSDKSGSKTGSEDINFGGKDIYVVMKVKPLPKSGTDLLKLAVDQQVVSSSSNTWELPYVIESIKDTSDKGVSEGLSIGCYVEFDTLANSISVVKDGKVQLKDIGLKFINRNKIKNSH